MAGDTHGTYDQMPTLVGWNHDGSEILYMEQNGTVRASPGRECH